ncbi:MAG: hypothetical protein HXX12_03295 [Geothrix sp.]|uniref:hypothetical protein n=1 Tax=Geothrix sp. TaxID=1962974 RepID=UPI001822F9D9|nr:hypothetical protein [Geothrix sp.]NWJ39984.1 hypothetical protein [Geothrix sp.]WIL22005.1 MAG: hypothetical protein QOZ81_001291 [Geothrix sp.]
MTAYTREEKDWLEREWAFRAWGRAGLLSTDDYRQVLAWEAEAVPMDLVVAALNTFFDRREKREKLRTFVALKHLDRDVAKAVKLRESLLRAGPAMDAGKEWAQVKAPLRDDPAAKAAFEVWQRLQASAPSPEAAGYLAHHDQEREARATLLGLAEAALGPAAEALREELRQRLEAADMKEGSLVWKRAWNHHWARLVASAWGLPLGGA